mmetsp:Transcript_126396/g.300113  ORF Transcript_126396/g.300113 Transcript_126396/m.300113 type:complete len:202 (-) Transcript_126396:159-764(-)
MGSSLQQQGHSLSGRLLLLLLQRLAFPCAVQRCLRLAVQQVRVRQKLHRQSFQREILLRQHLCRLLGRFKRLHAVALLHGHQRRVHVRLEQGSAAPAAAAVDLAEAAHALLRGLERVAGIPSFQVAPGDALPSAALQQAIPGDAEEPRGEEQHLQSFLLFQAHLVETGELQKDAALGLALVVLLEPAALVQAQAEGLLCIA